jgi:predicted ABC-type ATPase
MNKKNIYIIAGPNGAGKTTFAKKFLPDYAKCQHFVNADLIAYGLSPFSPRIAAMKAGRLVLEQIHDMADKNVDFAFETTLSGKSYVNFLKEVKRKGYYLHFFFLWIPSPELALARIKDRVAEGGHDVPAGDVRRRFGRGIQNLFRFYGPLLDSWMFFDNAGSVPHLIAEEKKGKIAVIDKKLYDMIIGGNL